MHEIIFALNWNNYLYQEMIRQGYLMQELADKIGISRQHLSTNIFRKGKAHPATVAKVCAALEVPIADILNPDLLGSE